MEKLNVFGNEYINNYFIFNEHISAKQKYWKNTLLNCTNIFIGR